MRSLIPSPLRQMNTAVLTPQRSDRLLPSSYFICEPGGSCKGKKGLFNNVTAEPPQSKNGLNLGSWLTWPLLCCLLLLGWVYSVSDLLPLTPPSAPPLLYATSQNIIHPPVTTTCLIHHISNSTLWCLKGYLQYEECVLLVKTLCSDI